MVRTPNHRKATQLCPGVEIKLFYSPNASNFCICRVIYEDHSPLWRVIRQLNTSPVSSGMDASH